MPQLDPAECRERLLLADHGVLATVSASGRPHVVPVCFVVEGSAVVVPVDDVKAKSTPRLQRVTNALETGRAALLVEDWHRNDWARLWWVRADLAAAGVDAVGRASTEASLREKYAQYRDASFPELLVMRMDRLIGWSASPVG